MDRNLNNIYVKESGEGLKYKPVSTGQGKSNFPPRSSRRSHGERIESQFEIAWKEAEKTCNDRLAVSASGRDGVYLQIRGKEGYELVTKSLENVREGVRLANIQEIEGVVHATVFIPNRKHDFFIKKINKYMENTKGTDVIGTIENIQSAMVEAFWIGDKNTIPTDTEKQWCEVWIRYDMKEPVEDVLHEFREVCMSSELAVKHQHISFPERIVVGVFADKQDLSFLLGSSNRIAEFRKMSSLTSFFVNMDDSEQREWTEDLASRIRTDHMTDTSVCLLDTGVDNGHPLLEKVLQDKDKFTIDAGRGVDDKDGHGTKMAGIASMFTLEDKLESTEIVEINHFLESVKMFDYPKDNPEELYGSLTADAISIAEIENPQAKRAICMAITSDTSIEKDGRPSSWSGALDSIISGAEEEDVKRMMIVSAGNTTIQEIIDAGDYQVAVTAHSVEDPAQAWNVVTVGAFTQLDETGYPGYEPLARSGDYSPFTSSSVFWNHSKWPIKPEIMFEGGNLAYSEKDNFYSETEDLSLLTTSHKYMVKKPFDTISMTSSATAQASWMAANIWERYPDLWPETVRALMIHSADWTEQMIESINPSKRLSKSDYRNLLRTCGYGVPSLDKALWSAQNSVNLIIEDELEPFVKNGSSLVSNEMHIHTLPWPTDLLANCENANVRMRVTLSYYIEPGPGEIGWKDKYRYPSVGLSFDVNNPMEDRENFTGRISKAMREDENEKTEIKNDSSRWRLGSNNRNVGSIHSDVWEGTARQLSESNMIIVYPKTGWWKSRPNLKKYDSSVRYSLIVTIEAPETEVELYTAIETEIKNRMMTKVSITAL